MEHSESLKELSTALSKAQAELKDVPRSASNPFFKSKYAPLERILEQVRSVLSRHGLSITQLCFVENDHANVETVLLHNSGEWISSKLSLKPTKSDPQGMGSAITYARRYSVSAIVGIASEEDDDGNAASGQGKKGKEKEEEVTKPIPIAIKGNTPEEISKNIRKDLEGATITLTSKGEFGEWWKSVDMLKIDMSQEDYKYLYELGQQIAKQKGWGKNAKA